MINNEINAIKDRICMTIMPKRIYLFGSFAKDNYNEDSDYDFYVVVPDDAGNKIELSQKAYKSLRGVRKRPVDIVVGYESSFDIRAKENTLEKVVKQEGVLLYENEDLLKGVLISKGVMIKKTHDLGLLAEMLQEYVEIDEKYYRAGA